MVVSFPMYNLPEMQQSLRRWWSMLHKHLVNRGINAPAALFVPPADLMQHWRDDELLLSQTCGFPLVSQLQRQVKIVGTPVYSVDCCQGSAYCSFVIVRREDARDSIAAYRGARLTFNGVDSQSGFNALRVALLDNNLTLPFFGENLQSGGHRQSILNVARGRADICAVDCVTHALLAKHQPTVLAGTRILATTRLTPGLPLITSKNTDEHTTKTMFEAIKAVCQDESMHSVNRQLLLSDIEKRDMECYRQAVSIPPVSVSQL